MKYENDQKNDIIEKQQNLNKFKKSEGLISEFEQIISIESQKRKEINENTKKLHQEAIEMRNNDHQNFKAIQVEMNRIN